MISESASYRAAGVDITEQTTSSYYMILIGLFLEILQRVERLRAFLYLVKYDKRFPGCYLFPCNHRKQFDDALGIFIYLENRLKLVLLIEVEVYIVVVAALPEFLHKPGLPHLTGAANYQRLPFGAFFPLFKVVYRYALQ